LLAVAVVVVIIHQQKMLAAAVQVALQLQRFTLQQQLTQSMSALEQQQH
jgi:hypothetical protein